MYWWDKRNVCVCLWYSRTIYGYVLFVAGMCTRSWACVFVRVLLWSCVYVRGHVHTSHCLTSARRGRGRSRRRRREESLPKAAYAGYAGDEAPQSPQNRQQKAPRLIPTPTSATSLQTPRAKSERPVPSRASQSVNQLAIVPIASSNMPNQARSSNLPICRLCREPIEPGDRYRTMNFHKECGCPRALVESFCLSTNASRFCSTQIIHAKHLGWKGSCTPNLGGA